MIGKRLAKCSLWLCCCLAAGWEQPVQAENIQVEEEAREQQEILAMFADEFQEEDVYRAQEMLISATGSLKPLRLAPSVASIITAKEIKTMGAATLDEILETVPGLHVAPSGLNIFSSIWSIRGIRTSINPQVLLLINSIPVTNSASGDRLKCFQMPVAMISRVEVIRGPGSAVHGADAFAGTINVITKDGHEVNGTEAGLRYGSFDTTDAWFQHGGTYGGWNLAAGIESRKSQGDDERIISQDRLGSSPPSQAPGELDTSYDIVNVNLGLNREDRWIGHFNGYWSNDNTMGPGGAQALTNGNVSDSRQLLLDLTYNNDDWIKNWDLSLQTSYLYQKVDNHFQFFPPTVLNMRAQPVVTSKAGGMELSAFYTGLADHKVRLAAGIKFFDVNTDEYKNFGPGVAVLGGTQFGSLLNITDTPYIFMKDQNRRLCFFSFQDEWHISKGWELTAGVRYDEYDDFGSTINPRLALVWEVRYDLTAKLMYGSAFRAPSFTEQYIQNNPMITGNSNLDPETIDTYELAFTWEPTAGLQVMPSLFYYEIEDIIEYSETAPFAAENDKNLNGCGFELEFRWHPLNSLEIKGNLAYQRSRDNDSHEIIADTPEWQFYSDATWNFTPDWSLTGQYFWIADRHRANGDVRSDIDDYDLVNLTLRRKNIGNHFEYAFSVHNLFNEDVREPSPYDPDAPDGGYMPNDYPMESRAIWAEVRVHF